ncbi:hypothetical protein [Streptomyces sp. NPDC004266]|uniref:hypothetical protein n=1 Tax=Streptomyces sp. NPDC004266 TaxID=3364693 RepID=UPI003679FD9A
MAIALATWVAQGGVTWLKNRLFPPPPVLGVEMHMVDPLDECEGGNGYVFPKPVSELDGFGDLKGSTDPQSARYLQENGAVAGQYVIIELTLQPNRNAPVSVESVKVNVKETLAPFPQGAHLHYSSQCGGVDARTFLFDLDRSPRAYTVIGNPHIGGDQQFSKLPTEPEPGKTMKLYVVPYGLRHGYRFTLTLEWVEGAKRISKVIDNHGQDFLIMPSVPDQNYYTYGNPGERLKKTGDSRPWFLNPLLRPSPSPPPASAPGRLSVDGASQDDYAWITQYPRGGPHRIRTSTGVKWITTPTRVAIA